MKTTAEMMKSENVKLTNRIVPIANTMKKLSMIFAMKKGRSSSKSRSAAIGPNVKLPTYVGSGLSLSHLESSPRKAFRGVSAQS